MSKTAKSRAYQLSLAAALIVCSAQAVLAQLSGNCIVSVLNRTVYAKSDGSWVLPNIPAGFGLVRARATCVDKGITRFGESDFFDVPANGVVNLPKITLGTMSPIPSTLTLTSANLVFNSIGQTQQLAVTATYPNASTKNVTTGATGTSYTSSNPAIATVSPNGLVTALNNGVVLIQAINDGTPGFVRASIVLSGSDTDGDGIPDADEIALGLDPRNPVDAEEDFDRDGLTNLQEYQLGTNIRKADTDDDGLTDGEEFLIYHTDPLVADTDGDRIPDGVEVKTGTNPLDRNSYDLRLATSKAINPLAGSVVQPSPFVLIVNTLFPDVSQLLSWKATLIDGKTTLDLINDPRTTFASSNLSVCNFSTEPGRIFGGQSGQCVITLTNNTLSENVSGTVQSFSPVGLSSLDIPGFANNVDVSGDYAYVAAGASGLQIVDVKNKLSPRIASSVALAGNANDVVVVGSFAYVAAGSAGLHVINVSNPLAPMLAGSLNTGGVAYDVVVKSNRAYVANGANGLVIADVSSPGTPAKLGSISLTGTAKGVDVDTTRQIAAAAMGTNGLAVVNVANPANPLLLATLDASTDDIRDVAVSGNTAYLADYNRSFTSVDLTNPNSPVLLASTPKATGGLLMDVAVVGTIAAGADVFFVNGVPLIDVSNPANPQPRAILNFNFGPGNDFNGTGIAMDSAYVYLTAESPATIGTDNGTTGTTRLYIGEYLWDSVAPLTITITNPSGTITVPEGATFDVTGATTGRAVASVSVLLDGQVIATRTAPPYQFSVTAPVGQTSTTLTARAADTVGNTAVSPGITINIAKDTVKPTVQITSPVGGTIAKSGVVTEIVDATDDVRVARVEFLVNGTIFATRTAPPYEASFTVPTNVTSLRFGARAADPAGNIGVAQDVTVQFLPNTFSWAKRIGGTQRDYASGIASDSAGNIYVAGNFEKTVSVGPGTSFTSAGFSDIFVAKFDTGGTLLWAKHAGGTSFAQVYADAVAVDSAGFSYVTGSFFGTVTFAPGQSLTTAGNDIFVAKYDGSGNLVWVKQAGGTGFQDAAGGHAIAVDTTGNIYITGEFYGTLSVGPGFTLFTGEGDTELFVAMYDGSGNPVWAKQAGGVGTQVGRRIAVDGAGNVYVTGDFADFVTFPGLPTLIAAGTGGNTDIFVAKYDPFGNPVWAKRAGDGNGSNGTGIAVDNLGNSYVSGYFGLVGGVYVFLVKYDTFGNPVWTQGASGDDFAGGLGIAMDGAGNSYVTGQFFGTTTTFAPGVTADGRLNNNFVAKYDSNGGLLWVNVFKLSSNFNNVGIAIDGAANSYLTGGFFGTATFATGSSFISAGDVDIFIAKYGVQ